ncbi:hypothetical protein BH09PSE1_BH09PSE1_17260 [soil metagenome]
MSGLKILVLSALILPLAVGGCGRSKALNPPTEPAQAIDQPDVAPPATGSSGGGVAGTGPISFVGRWTADVSQCANPQGTNRPIQITPIRFETSDKSCHIYSVDETANGYLAVLKCRPQGQPQGVEHQERVHLSVVGQTLTLGYPDQGGAQVKLLKCTTLTDVAPTKVD